MTGDSEMPIPKALIESNGNQVHDWAQTIMLETTLKLNPCNILQPNYTKPKIHLHLKVSRRFVHANVSRSNDNNLFKGPNIATRLAS